ncbi:hypothetical protein ACKKBG_A18760 [Auxenochlorella protothecoides x Auxenochlorella symbiontica]
MTEASAPHKELQARVQRCVTSWQEHLARQSATLQAAVNQHVEGAHHGIQALGQQLARLRVPPPAQRPQPSVLLASITTAARVVSGSAPQPAFDLALAPEEIKARLANVPVFTVVNGKEEFVLVTGEQAEKRQLGLFFFNEADAQALVATMKASDAAQGRAARVLPTSLASVYDFALTPRASTGLEGVTFRFVPEPGEVAAALQLYNAAGVSAGGFMGVPLFQAEGLTVMSEGKRCTPLFFSKADLDVALGTAAGQKHEEMLGLTRQRAEEARKDVQRIRDEVASAGEDKAAKAAAERQLKPALEAQARYQARTAQLEDKKVKVPRVDLGSLEEVLGRMEADARGEWADVLFIPSGTMMVTGKKKGR